MCAAGLAFAVLGVCVKAASETLTTAQVVFLRAFVGLLFLLPWVWRAGWRQLATARPGAHLARGTLGVAAMFAFFYALDHLTLAEAVLLSYTTPLFTPLVARWWLREPLSRRLWAAVGIGFLGVAVVLRPEAEGWPAAAWVGLAAGALAAGALVVVRAMSDSEPPLRIVFYFSLVSTLVSLPWAWRAGLDFEATGVVWMVVGGAVASLGQWLLTQAYASAPAAVVGPFTFSTVLFAALLGWGLWGERLDQWTALGGLAIVIGGVLALRR